jgi:hypothetical protein
MHRYFILLFPVLLCLYQCKEKKSTPTKAKAIGLGLLTVNTAYPLQLFSNETDSIPFAILKFEQRRSGVTAFVTRIKLDPYLMSEGDSDEEGKRNISMGLIRFSPELKFRIVDTTASSFTVVTNEKTWQTFVIKKDSLNAYYTTEQQLFDNNCSNCPGSNYNSRWYIFETWERYLKRVEYITKENLVIYDKPDGKAIFENRKQDFLPFGVEDVKGEWIKLKKGFGRESNFDSLQNYSNGWTQWRKGPQMLIDITEHTYE